jgi:N4-gp56 family major capsid protein
MSREYNDPAGGTDSDIGSQIRTDHFIKTALIEARREQYFMQLSGTTNLPKNMGKKIKKYQYMALLDDANINDQGIDAAGATIVNTNYEVRFQASLTEVVFTADEAGATALAGDQATGTKSGAGPWTVTFDPAVTSIVCSTQAIAVSLQGTTVDTLGAVVSRLGGNLYGSSKDIGSISSKLPTLSENGGRVNRVGFKRVELEGSIAKFGFFDEWSQEAIDFDSDADLQMHVNREMINGASEITEDALQIDLLNSAGVVRYAGNAVSTVSIDSADVVDYDDLLRVSIELDNNRTPKQTKIITGTRLVDTKVISGGRVLYCGSELLPTLEAMTDLHSAKAYIQVQHYAAGTTVLTGEEGSVGHFRVVIVPEMLKWAGAGADSTSNATHYETGNAYDVFPLLVVGDGSFTTIGFQTDGKTVKFKITSKAPGPETADRTDPYGETGFMSIKWYYGFMLERSERIALIKTAAKL